VQSSSGEKHTATATPVPRAATGKADESALSASDRAENNTFYEIHRNVLAHDKSLRAEHPFAGQFIEDLRPLFEVGAMRGERLMPELVKLLGGPGVSYGKGGIVGVAGEMEHGGACVHPMLGRPIRAAIGGGKAVIGSNVKVAAAGASLDVPLGHKDHSWSFPYFDTITVSVADAPRPDEILVVMAIADGGRQHNRCGNEPIR
jgi:hypothetical protein